MPPLRWFEVQTASVRLPSDMLAIGDAYLFWSKAGSIEDTLFHLQGGEVLSDRICLAGSMVGTRFGKQRPFCALFRIAIGRYSITRFATAMSKEFPSNVCSSEPIGPLVVGILITKRISTWCQQFRNQRGAPSSAEGATEYPKGVTENSPGSARRAPTLGKKAKHTYSFIREASPLRSGISYS